ncbi:unknown [Prevotella sp. CAG:5226]|nr:unknown [Prevotella sp. CAG:5226]
MVLRRVDKVIICLHCYLHLSALKACLHFHIFVCLRLQNCLYGTENKYREGEKTVTPTELSLSLYRIILLS